MKLLLTLAKVFYELQLALNADLQLHIQYIMYIIIFKCKSCIYTIAQFSGDFAFYNFTGQFRCLFKYTNTLFTFTAK